MRAIHPTCAALAACLVASAQALPAEQAAEPPVQPVPGASFNVTPLRLDIAAADEATQMFVRNTSGRPLAVQVRLFSWTQADGGDLYSPSDELIISPSIIRIEPDRIQTFHVASRGGDSVKGAGGERHYRVVIDQLPDGTPAAPGTAQTRLRMTVPLFVGSDAGRPAQLAWRIERGALLIQNSGGRTARIAGLRLIAGGAPAKTLLTGPRYVLGQSWVKWALPAGIGCASPDIRIAGTVDQKTFDVAPAQICS